MAARQASVSSPHFGDDIKKLLADFLRTDNPTRRCFDNALEFLTMGGYSLAHAMMMMIPEAWAGQSAHGRGTPQLLRIQCRADGAVGRPRRASPSPTGVRSVRRWTATACARRATSSPRTTASSWRRKWRAADPAGRHRRQMAAPARARCSSSISSEGRLIPDDEIKASLARSHPYGEWLERTQIVLEDLPCVCGNRADLKSRVAQPATDLRLYPGRPQDS